MVAITVAVKVLSHPDHGFQEVLNQGQLTNNPSWMLF